MTSRHKWAAILALVLTCSVAPGASAAALDTLRQQAESGDPNAQFLLAVELSGGLGAPKDQAQALIWFMRAAAQGNPLAEFNIGQFYAQGWGGLAPDQAAAVDWYRKAAEHNDAKARAALRDLYYQGKLHPQAEAADGAWWRDLAEQARRESEAFAETQTRAVQGDAEAQTATGILYMTGTGVSRDRDLAMEWLSKAAAHGQLNAGCLSTAIATANTGLDTPADNAHEFKACLAAAEAGFAEAQLVLSTFYATGRGASRNDEQAAQWALKAAEQGRADAEELFVYYFTRGKGVPPDKNVVLAWRIKAAQQYRTVSLMILQGELVLDKNNGLADGLPAAMRNPAVLGDLAVEHGFDDERDLLPNLWASPAHQARQKEAFAPIAKALGAALHLIAPSLASEEPHN